MGLGGGASAWGCHYLAVLADGKGSGFPLWRE